MQFLPLVELFCCKRCYCGENQGLGRQFDLGLKKLLDFLWNDQSLPFTIFNKKQAKHLVSLLRSFNFGVINALLNTSKSKLWWTQQQQLLSRRKLFKISWQFSPVFCFSFKICEAFSMFIHYLSTFRVIWYRKQVKIK